MTRVLTVVFDGEVLRPEEPIDLAPHTRYRISIEEPALEEQPAPAPGVFDDLLELAQELDLPPDLSAQMDHYLHGAPKR
ncbi:MAG: antitoxin family protein [Dehalococcoidia bacterium]